MGVLRLSRRFGGARTLRSGTREKKLKTHPLPQNILRGKNRELRPHVLETGREKISVERGAEIVRKGRKIEEESRSSASSDFYLTKGVRISH